VVVFDGDGMESVEPDLGACGRNENGNGTYIFIFNSAACNKLPSLPIYQPTYPQSSNIEPVTPRPPFFLIAKLPRRSSY
jgi:hypothetical protein